MDQYVHIEPQIFPLTANDKRRLRANLMTRMRLIKRIALVPLVVIFFTALSVISAGLGVLVIEGLADLFGMTLFAYTAALLLVAGMLLSVVVNYFVFRNTIAEYRSRFSANLPLNSDLADGVKLCETLRIDEALCVQESEHNGLAYFCRVADGRVIFVHDYGSACWEDKDLAAAYRRGVDPRQEHFVPTDTLRVCRAPASGQVFEEDFSGQRVPLVEGIYWCGVTELPESGNFIDMSWTTVLTQYKHDERLVKRAEVIRRAAKTSMTG